MLYAREVMEVMGPYPGRHYRMGEIVREIVGRRVETRRRHAVREAVRLVLQQLVASGAIEVVKAETRGSFNIYIWKSAR